MPTGRSETTYGARIHGCYIFLAGCSGHKRTFGEKSQEAVSGAGGREGRRSRGMREEVTHGEPREGLQRGSRATVCLFPEEYLPAGFICSRETTT